MGNKSLRQSIRESVQDFLVQAPLYRITDNPLSAVSALVSLFVWLINGLTHLSPSFQPYLTGAVVASLLILSVNVIVGIRRRKPPVKPPSLKDLFETDWSDLTAYYSITTLGMIADGKPTEDVTLAWRLNGDFGAKSKFLAVWLDHKLPPLTALNVCVWIANNYEDFINTTNAEVDICGQWPTDSSATHLRDMVFSGRIFVYYGHFDLSQEQKGSLEVLFKQKGLSIQFRTMDYQWLHREDKVKLRPHPVVPHSVLLPRATGSGFRISVQKLSP